MIVFPSVKRVGKVRRLAEPIFNATDKGAAAHWRRCQGDMRRQMGRAGIPADRIEIEGRAFCDAVEAQMRRLAYACARRRPEGGDAA